jgi:glycosyltransferase involved in cell wall biosynthesis
MVDGADETVNAAESLEQRSAQAGARTFSPFVSVAVRAFRRVPQLLELTRVLLDQQYPSFEIVIIEQSGEEREPFRAELAALTSDPRVRLLAYPPLGAGRARIEAARQSRGELIVFMDDDDLPRGTSWLATLVSNFENPHCMGASGRQVVAGEEESDRHDTARNRRRCLRHSFLRMPSSRVQHHTRVEGVTHLSGGNTAIRASAIERTGGWDPEDDHDEDSFSFRFERVRQPGDFFVYDPRAVMLRRLDVPGGLARRTQGVAERVRAELRYSHRVVRKYYPVRFFLLYPCYLWLAAVRALHHVRQAQPQRRWHVLLLELMVSAPVVYLELLASLERGL